MDTGGKSAPDFSIVDHMAHFLQGVWFFFASFSVVLMGCFPAQLFYIMILFAGGRNIHRIPLWRRFLCAAGVLRFAPVAVIFGALVAGFHRLIGAHTHIVFFAVFQSGDGFFGGAVFAHRNRLCVFKVRRCTVLDLIPGGLGGLLFPSYGNFLFPPVTLLIDVPFGLTVKYTVREPLYFPFNFTCTP